MADINWIKIKVGMFDDEKIKLIQSMPEGDALIVIWIRLLCLAGKTNQNGYIQLNENIGYNDEMLSTIFAKDIKVVRLALVTLQSFSMIEVFKNNVIHVENWEKHQNIDGLDKIRQLNSERQKKFREKQKQLETNNLTQKNNNKEITLHNVTVTQQIRSDIEKEIDNNIIIAQKNKNLKKEVDNTKKILNFKNEINKILNDSTDALFKNFFTRNNYENTKNFINYWIEPNKTKKKLKFEIETEKNKTWDTNLRLFRWWNNSNEYKETVKQTNDKNKTQFPKYL